MPDWAAHYQPLMLAAPVVLTILVLVLAQLFSQGRIGQMAILVLATFGLVQWRLQSSLNVPQTWLMYFWLTLLWPINVLAIRYLPERRPISLSGVLVLLFLLSEGLIITLLPDSGWWQGGLESIMSFRQQPLPALVNFTLVVLVMLLRLPRQPDLPVAFAAITILHGMMFFSFASSFISVLVASLALLLLFVTLLINNH